MADDAELISRVVVSDDHDAFAELVRRHQSAVRQFLRRLTGHQWDRADDLAQETFWRAYRHLATFQGRGRFLSWLFGIAYQRFITEARRAGGAFVALDDDIAVDIDASQQVADRLTFDQLMAMLRTEERAAVILHYRHELTHLEIADTMALPIGTVKTLIRRARLKRKLPTIHARARQTMDDMKTITDDDGFDLLLAAALDQPPLPDVDFTSGLSERLRRHRQRRRLAVWAGVLLGISVMSLGLYVSPAPFAAASLISPQGIALALVLTALCSLVWIETESRSRLAIR